MNRIKWIIVTVVGLVLMIPAFLDLLALDNFSFLGCWGLVFGLPLMFTGIVKAIGDKNIALDTSRQDLARIRYAVEQASSKEIRKANK